MEIGSISKHTHEVGGHYLVRSCILHLNVSSMSHNTDLASLLLNIVSVMVGGQKTASQHWEVPARQHAALSGTVAPLQRSFASWGDFIQVQQRSHSASARVFQYFEVELVAWICCRSFMIGSSVGSTWYTQYVDRIKIFLILGRLGWFLMVYSFLAMLFNAPGNTAIKVKVWRKWFIKCRIRGINVAAQSPICTLLTIICMAFLNLT